MLHLKQYWYEIRSSFWFVPNLIVVGAIVLAVAMIELDGWVEADSLAEWPRLFGAGADGARGLLTAIATSMITVAGVVFSITLVALSLTSSQYTSRVLRNFMRNRINQTVLGIFVGIFAYCLLVLRTIRGGNEGTFVPSLSVLLALVFGVIGISFLIFFIHHISVSIQASQILAEVFYETQHVIERLYPEPEEENKEQTEAAAINERDESGLELTTLGRSWQSVSATKTGYLQSLDTSSLAEEAESRDLVISFERAVGEFVIEETPIARLLLVKPLKPDDLGWLSSGYSVGRERTLEQDFCYGLRQLVDLALKALSPGINDTTTAVMTIQYLTALLVKLAPRPMLCCYRTKEGVVRIVTTGPNFRDTVGLAFDQIRDSGAGNAAILNELGHSLSLLVPLVKTSDRRQVLRDQTVSLLEVINRTVAAPGEQQKLQQAGRQILADLDSSAASEGSSSMRDQSDQSEKTTNRTAAL